MVVGVWLPGKGEFTKGFGYSNLATHSPMALDDHFRIGSNTKTFVATVLLQLVDEKKLSLDDTIGKFNLGFAIPNERQITLRQLAEMRSGIINEYSVPGVQQKDEAWWSRQTPRQWVELAAKQPLLFAPGTKYNYSNTNWFLLGLIIEKITHDTIQNEIHKRILAPMALTQTSFPTTDWECRAIRARIFFERKEPMGQRVGGTRPIGFLGGRGNDFRHGRHEAVGQSLRNRHHEPRRVAEGATGVSVHGRRKPCFWSRHRLFGRMVRVHRRHHRLQYGSVLHARDRRHGHRVRQQPTRAAFSWSS